MKMRLAGLCATLALAACKDSSTAPAAAARAAGQTASFATAFDSGGGGPGQSHFVANGDFGAVNWFGFGSAIASDTGGGGGGGFTFGSLNVSRGGATNNPQSFLSYFVEQCDVFFNCNFFGGFGLIPNHDLSGGGKTFHLSTNTNGNANFVTFAGPAGLVSVDWTANGFFQQRFSGTSQISFPGFAQKSTGVSTAASANATGSVVGVSISPNNSGNIGSNTSVTIDIFH